jgi:hypothetical protein
MNEFCVITASGLPSIDGSYLEIKIVPDRLVQDGLFEDTKILTEKKYKTVGSDVYDSRLIQSIFYQKYYLEYYCGETEVPELLPHFETVTITDQFGKSYNARHITVEKTKVQDTFKMKVKISFVDFIPSDFVTNNYLESSQVLAEGFSNYQLQFTTSRTVTGFTSGQSFYTRLEKENTLKVKPVKIEYKGQKYLAQTLNYEAYKLMFYLTEADLKKFELCAATADGVSLIGDTTITITEPIEYEIKENSAFIDLYGVEVTLLTGKYQFDNYLETQYLNDIAGITTILGASNTTTIDATFTAWAAYYGSEVILNTMFTPDFEHPKIKNEDKIELNGIEIPTYQVGVNSAIIKVIANSANYAKIMKYIGMCDTIFFTYDGTTYTAIEKVEVEDKKNKELIDLFEIDITVKYSITNFNPYA